MSNFAADVGRLDRVLAEAVPESRDWVRTVDNASETWAVELTSPAEVDSRTLSIVLHDGDIHVAFSVGPSCIGRGPYEVNTSMPDEHDATALAEFATFVADLLNERLVLAMQRGWLGGRTFLKPDELTPARRYSLEWIASWRGTYDAAIPTA